MVVAVCAAPFSPKLILQGPYSNRGWGDGDCGPCSMLAFANMVSCNALWPLMNSAQKRYDLIVTARQKGGAPATDGTTVAHNAKAWSSAWMTGLFTSVNLVKPTGTIFNEANDGDFDTQFLTPLINGKVAMLAVRYGPIDWFPATSEGDFLVVDHKPDTRHAISGQWCFRTGHMISARNYRLASGLAASGIPDGTPICTIIDPLDSGGFSSHGGAICHANTPPSSCPPDNDCADFGSGMNRAAGPQTITISALKAACGLYAGTNQFNGIVSGAALTIADPPVANFTYAQNSGTLAVQYTDTSFKSPTSWAWSFGDGTASTQQNPLKTFSASGIYSTRLTATNAYGNNAHTASVTVDPIPPPGNPPVASFTYNQNSGTLVEQFTDTSSYAPTSWLWDFGDGGTSTVRNPWHTYAAGTYNVTLTATNAYGSAQSVHSVTVSGLVPVAGFGYSQVSGTLDVTFTDVSTRTPTSWSWNFGDGSALSTVQNPTHSFPSALDWNVALTATNASGNSTNSKLVTVEPAITPPVDPGYDPTPRDPCISNIPSTLQ